MSNFSLMQLMGGIDPDGKIRAIAVNADGAMQMSSNQSLGRKIAFIQKSVDYTLTYSDDFLAVDCSNQPITITLPSAINVGTIYEIKKIDNTSNSINIVTINSQTIDGISSFILNTYNASINLVATGSNWLIF